MARSFAHLLGLGRPAAGKPKSEEDEDDDNKKRDEDEGGAGASEEDDEDEKKEGKKARGKKADDGDEDDDESMSEEGDDDEDDEKPKQGKKSRAEDGDDDDDKKDEGDAKATAARRRERARCAAIFGSKHAATRPDMAAHLAFSTNLSRREARNALAAAAAGQPKVGGGLASRMAGMEQIRPGADAPSSRPTTASSWEASGKRTGLLK